MASGLDGLEMENLNKLYCPGQPTWPCRGPISVIDVAFANDPMMVKDFKIRYDWSFSGYLSSDHFPIHLTIDAKSPKVDHRGTFAPDFSKMDPHLLQDRLTSFHSS